MRWRYVRALALGALASVAAAAAAPGDEAPPVPLATWTDPGLGADWLTLGLARQLFAGADEVKPLEADPPAAPVYSAGVLQGYVFVTRDVTESLGFSSLEFLIAVGLRLDGTLGGVRVVEHREPIIDLIMLEDLVPRFARQYAGVDIRAPLRVSLNRVQEPGAVDGISAATISAVLFNEAILRAARLVAQARGIRLHDKPVLDILRYRPADFASLAADGALGRLSIDKAQAAAAGVPDPDLSASGGVGDLYVYAHERDNAPAGPAWPDGLLLDLYAGPVMTPTIGRNLLGDKWYDLFVSGRDPNDLMLGLMSVGPYSIDGEKRISSGPFKRLRLLQDGAAHELSKDNYRYLGFLHGADKPEFAEIGLFWIPAESGIDPVKPWSLEVAVESADGADRAAFRLDYALPDEFVLMPSGLDDLALDRSQPAWMAAWRTQGVNLAILAAMLGALCVILARMDALARRPALLRWTRIAFLAFVVGWLGWTAGAQLTVVNILTWLQSTVHGEGLAVFLSDPLIVAIALFAAATFFLFGRGIFCGWLCPFGALQELLGKAAQALGLRQIELGHRAHRLLWPVKYVVLAVLVGLSFHSMTMANEAAEVEPFKTAISLHFDRAWPYVLYAAALLAAGLVVERFFCRFLCPLGAAMAIAGKLRVANFLKRRAECGSPCQLCSRRCPIGAIEPGGRIRMSECFYCLDCQALYHDEHVCPPLVRARRGARAAPAVGGALAAGAASAGN